MKKQVTSYLALYKKERGETKFYPICPFTFRRLKKAEFIYDWGGIINTFVKIAFKAEDNKRIMGGMYFPTEYQVRDKNGNIYTTRTF